MASYKDTERERHNPVERLACPMCFTADTLVSTDNDLIPINKLNGSVDSLGKDRRKSKQIVLQSFAREYCGEIIKLKVRYLPPVNITPEHPILVRHLARPYHRQSKHRMSGGPMLWKRACDLSSGDFVLIPRAFCHPRRQYLDFSPFVRKFTSNLPSAIMGRVVLDETWAELFGWYVAEGHPSPKEVTFSFGGGETNRVERIRWLARKIGYSTYTRTDTRTGVVQVSITSRVLPRAFTEWFGKGARAKKVSQFIMKANSQIRRAFLEAYFAGDGHLDLGRARRLVSSASERLIRQVQLLYFQEGICMSYSKGERAGIIEGRVLPKTVRYILESGRYSKYAIITRRFIYLPVQQLERAHYKGLVYNLQTDDGTYQVPFLVHNCGWVRTVIYGKSQRTGVPREVRFDKMDVEHAPIWRLDLLTGRGRGSKDATIELVDSKTLAEVDDDLKEQIRRQCHRILEVLGD